MPKKVGKENTSANIDLYMGQGDSQKKYNGESGDGDAGSGGQ